MTITGKALVEAGCAAPVPKPARILTIGILASKLQFSDQRALLMEGHLLRILPYPTPPADVELGDISGLARFYPGQITVVRTVADMLDGADLVWSDYCDVDSDVIEEIHEGHSHVIGLDSFVQRLEIERGFGRMFAGYLGLDINSQGRWVRTLEEAQQFMNQEGVGNVLFKSTTGSTLPTVRPPTREEALDMIEVDPFDWFSPEEGVSPGVFIDSEMTGNEISYFGYFNGESFIAWGMTQEHKVACDGNRGGVMTGEVGTAFRFLQFNKLPPRFQMVFTRLETILGYTYYRGFIDLNCLVTDDGLVQFMEFTCRPGYPTEQELISHLWTSRVSYGDWLAGLAGVGPVVTVPNGVGIGLTLHAQNVGFPGASSSLDKWQPIIHWLTTGTLPGSTVQPFFVAWDEKGRWRSNYLDRSVLAVGHHKSEWSRAAWRAYSAINLVSAWGHTFRTDIPMYDPSAIEEKACQADSEQVADVRTWNSIEVIDATEHVWVGSGAGDWVLMLEWISYADNDRWTRDLTDLLCNSKSYRFYFARDKESGDVLGMLIIRHHRGLSNGSNEPTSDLVYVANIAVAPIVRRLGIAHQLYSKMLSDYPDAGAFVARPWNTGSENFHRALGWTTFERNGKTYCVKQQ